MTIAKIEKKLKSGFSRLILFVSTVSVLVGITLLSRIRSQIRIFLYPPRTKSPHIPSDFAIKQWESVRFQSSDGLKLFGWFIPPDPSSGGATLIFVHGHGQNRGELLAEAAMLRSYGYGALLFDSRNSGESEGWITTGYTETKDIKGAVNYLADRPDVNPDCIGLVGHSLGGTIAIQAAVLIPEVRTVIAQAPFSSLDDRLQEMLQFHNLPLFPLKFLGAWFFKIETGIDLKQVSPIDSVGALSHCAIMLIHGKRDEKIPVSHSQRIYDVAKEPKDIYILSDADHSGWHLIENDPKEFEQRLVTFLNRYLRKDTSHKLSRSRETQ